MFRTRDFCILLTIVLSSKIAFASDIVWQTNPNPSSQGEYKSCELSYLDEKISLKFVVLSPAVWVILSGRDSLGVDSSGLAKLEMPNGEKTKSAFIDLESDKKISIEYRPSNFSEFFNAMKANESQEAKFSIIVDEKRFEAKWKGFNFVVEPFEECLSKLWKKKLKCRTSPIAKSTLAIADAKPYH